MCCCPIENPLKQLYNYLHPKKIVPLESVIVDNQVYNLEDTYINYDVLNNIENTMKYIEPDKDSYEEPDEVEPDEVEPDEVEPDEEEPDEVEPDEEEPDEDEDEERSDPETSDSSHWDILSDVSSSDTS